MLNILARQPIVCWMVATLFEHCFQSDSYGVHPPRLTPFYVNILIVQTKRSLELYKKPENNKVKPKWVSIYESQYFHLLILPKLKLHL